MTIPFEVRNRFTRAVQFTAQIKCAEDASYSLKVGLAVMWGRKSGAVLSGAVLSGADLRSADLRSADLSGADLRSADLSGADLSGADLSSAVLSGADLSSAVLSGADLRGADLRDAVLSGVKLKRHIVTASRSDGYTFLAFDTDKGVMIQAGCRFFSVEHFRAHVATNYPGTPKAEETTAILDFIERRAAQPVWRP